MNQDTKTPTKQSPMKGLLGLIVIVLLIIGVIGIISRSNDNSVDGSNDSSISDPELDDIRFSVSNVRNDTTGNWRISTIAEPIVISDHAVAYYQKYIKDDKEIHAIVNFNQNTTTKIMKTPLGVSATVYEYVDGEEHDAKKLFSGMILVEKYYDSETGEEIKITE